MRGNVIELAVAVILGAAFTQIVDSLVSDIITPAILNPLLQAANVDNLSELAINGIKYGSFLAAVLSFVIVAFALYTIIRAFESMKRRMIRAEAVEEAVDPMLASQERLAQAIDRLTSTLESGSSGTRP
jgi:large conductance mechanosensitive channel